MDKQQAATILGITQYVTLDEIKAAYKKMAMIHHPDRPGGSSDKMKEINEAFDIMTGKTAAQKEASRSDWYREYEEAMNRAREERRRYRETIRICPDCGAERIGDEGLDVHMRNMHHGKYREGYRHQDKEREYDYASDWASRHARKGQYHKGVSCGKGNHTWVDMGNYQKCKVCNATKTKHTRAKSNQDYRGRVGGL